MQNFDQKKTARKKETMQEISCAFTELRSKRSGYQLKQQVTSFQNGELPGDQFFTDN